MNMMKFGDLMGKVNRGSGISKIVADTGNEIEICRCITPRDLRRGYVPKDDRFYFEANKNAVTEECGLNDGDLAFRHSGLLNDRNMIYLIEKDEDCIYVASDYIKYFSVDKLVALPKYIYYYFRSNKGYEQIQSCIKQGHAMNFLQLPELKELEIPVPSLEEQQKYIDECVSIENQINNLNEQIASQYNKLYEMFG